MKKILSVMLLVSSLFCKMPLHAYMDGFYARAMGGLSFEESLPIYDESLDDFIECNMKTGGFGSVAAGMEVRPNVKIELEYAYRRNAIKSFSYWNQSIATKAIGVSGNLTTHAYMVNALFELPINFCVTPYAGFGLGYSNSKLKARSSQGRDSATESGMAFQFLGGVSYPLTDCLDAMAEYRYFFARHDVEYHAVACGLGYRF